MLKFKIVVIPWFRISTLFHFPKIRDNPHTHSNNKLLRVIN